jgi:hypothetical protein
MCARQGAGSQINSKYLKISQNTSKLGGGVGPPLGADLTIIPMKNPTPRPSAPKPQPKELNHGFHGFHGLEMISDQTTLIRVIRAIRGKIFAEWSNPDILQGNSVFSFCLAPPVAICPFVPYHTRAII